MPPILPLVREARLLKSSPADVFRDIQAEADANPSPWREDTALERSLFGRNEPLVDLALAQYGTDQDIVSEIYEKAAATSGDTADERFKLGLRIACLSNRRVAVLDWDFPLN